VPSLSYDSKQHFDPQCVARAIDIVQPEPADEEACHVLIIWAMAMCRRQKKEIQPARLAAEKDLYSAIRQIKSAETALDLRRIYKRLAFQDRDDFDTATTGAIKDLARIRKGLEALLKRYRECRKKEAAAKGGRPPDVPKSAAADYAYCILVAYAKADPTLTTSGPFFGLAQVIYEGATGKSGGSFVHHCRAAFEERRSRPKEELRRGLRQAEAQRAAEITTQNR
jgi:hypothetical protein